MKHWVKRASAFGAMTMLLMAVSNADAGWGWYASSGGSGGSWGSYGSGGSSGGYASGGSWGGYASSGGGWGSHGSSGGGVLHRVAARIHSHHSGGGWGSSGGSWGGYASSGGSSGGSWGSHGSSGGGIISRIRAHRIAHRAYHSGGSSGGYSSWGSSGGYATATVTYGSSGSVSYGSSGSVSYSSPAVVYSEPVVYESYSAPACEGCSATGGVIYDSAPTPPTVPNPEVEAPTEAPMGDSAQSVSTPSTLLAVRVPTDAEVYVNGYRTKATGSVRRYRSAGLQEGREYTYEVRVVSHQDGTEVAQTKFVTMKAGDETELGFAFDSGSVAKTSLTLHVPEDATVTLAGAETKMEGTTRVFSTSTLEPGKAWEDYVVRVVVERDGQSLTKERMITVRGGEQHELAFDFDAVELASSN